MKKIKGDLVLTKDTEFDESIKVEGNIKGYFNLKVIGDIDARDIVAWNIDARNIDARDIDARDIDARDIVARDIVARNIDARNIDARDIVARDIVARDIIFCETIKLKDKNKGKIKARGVVRKRFELEQKEWESD